MANQLATRFVKQLIAAFSRFPTSKDTADLYILKLTNWQLRPNEWDLALDRLIEVHKEDHIPSLNMIYGYLKSAQAARADNRNGGLATFDMPNGYGYSLRVHNDGGVWIISDVITRDAAGTEKHLQKRHGEALGVALPPGATNIMVHPDNPADPAPEDMPSKTETKQIVEDTMDKIRTIQRGLEL